MHAAMLIAGVDPGSPAGLYGDDKHPEDQPPGYYAAKSALTQSILSGGLRAIVRRSSWAVGWDEDDRLNRSVRHQFALSDADNQKTTNVRLFQENLAEGSPPDVLPLPEGVTYRAVPDWHMTTVSVIDIRRWMSDRGVETGFFFEAPAVTSTAEPDYFDPTHERFAPKLAAAVRAWLAVENPEGRSPKQALTQWLRDHSAELGLRNADGGPNEQGIEECAKVANWMVSGGAPKTPGK